MSFISPDFVIFFSIVAPAFFLIAARWRWAWLLAASLVFYAAGGVAYLPLILFVIGANYLAARAIGSAQARPTRRLWLGVAIVASLGLLFVFKYYDFFNEALAALLGTVPAPLGLALPIGISFYTFQALSYTIDVYRGSIPAERHAGYLATFISFFPQLVAGPIERAGHLLPQFRQRQVFDADRAVSGFQRILWGVFKKVVIADRLALYVNAVYNDVGSYTGAPLILATVFFAFQIYCDFSAYSDIAIGTARVMGIDLMENFRQPYFAKSVLEFWRRWHISLGAWIRDYLFMPLGRWSARVSKRRYPIAREVAVTLFVMALVGLWHGAAWTFVIWGLLFGIYMGLETVFRPQLRRIPQNALGTGLQISVTFVLVNIAWVFFRANSLADAAYIFGHALDFGAGGPLAAPFAGGLLAPGAELALSLALIGLLLLADLALTRRALESLAARAPALLRWGAYYAMGAAVVFSGLYGTGAQQFIYFQF